MKNKGRKNAEKSSISVFILMQLSDESTEFFFLCSIYTNLNIKKQQQQHFENELDRNKVRDTHFLC